LKTTIAICLLALTISGCAIARYEVSYADGTKYKVYVGGLFKEPKISKASVAVGTNEVFHIDSYESRQDAAQIILSNLIDKAGGKL